MKSALAVSIAILALSAFPAAARPPSGAVEDTQELATRMITLPSRADGVVAVQGCPECKRETYTLGTEVRFYIEKVEVNYADFKLHVGTHPAAVVLLVTPVNKTVITRLIAQ